ncbi:heat shock protein Hsp20 [Cyclonatronum proteinivorum]|uniref:Heat shock protein Hsp20 n=1 Tax=Cyclonatronum proteinivorum TaxID=1457365 RepID=A0A345UJY7_9BACT|nr:Hsp20/alpha crystallin family protein [Cyclonatronum proteinivorum]AXJ00789.1 heat shock protein Hsp20 [Cyclonatronum proteinivorum]
MSQFNISELENRLAELGRDVQKFAENIGLSTVSERETGFNPRLDVLKEPHVVTVLMDLPGMEKDDIHVGLSGNQLTISGKREIFYATEAETLKKERQTGAFTRAVSMSAHANAAGIKAVFRNGVLRVTIPIGPEVPNTDKIIIE